VWSSSVEPSDRPAINQSGLTSLIGLTAKSQSGQSQAGVFFCQSDQAGGSSLTGTVVNNQINQLWGLELD
jgi:hypothetical protein